MKFEEVLPAFREGRRIKITNVDGMYQKDVSLMCELTLSRILSNNWEIVKEKVKKTVWVNIYQDDNGTPWGGGSVHDSKEHAERKRYHTYPYLGAHSITVEVYE
jgi:hypothetical protein